MVANCSVPAEILLPHISYRNLPAAIDWLSRVFGFVEHYRYGEPMSGAQIHLGQAYIMVRRREGPTPAELGFGTQSLTIFVEDVDGHFALAKAAGAEIVEDLHETIYGERQYGVLDLEGHHWLFSRHAQDVDPADWGATVFSRL
jgi:uncharacterized glyoxalase superfamily protein PhnB